MCAEQFSILSPGEKCQSKKGLVEILSFTFCQAFCSAIHLAIGFCTAQADLRELRPADAVLEDGDHDRVLRRFLSLLCGERNRQNPPRVKCWAVIADKLNSLNEAQL